MANGEVEKIAIDRDAVANRTPFSLGHCFQDFRPSGVIFHGLRIGLRIGKHAAVGGDDSDASAACAQLRNLIAQRRKLFRVFRRSGCPLGEAGLGDPGNRSELFETRALIVTTERSFRKEVHGEQDAHQQREKHEREFPE